jgi:hypothetical protein
MKLRGQLVPVVALNLELCNAMFTLMDRYYENLNPAVFAADLEQKQWVILLFDPRTEELCGFSTQALLEVSVAGRPVKALFSGDTIVARDRWGDPALAHVWGRLALSLIDRYAEEELHWFLISKGYKTYRFLPLFFHEFYPRVNTKTPDWAKDVIDALARFKYPDSYDGGAGVIRASASKDRLRPGIAEVTSERQRDPHVRFFLERNPCHARGDELCCIAPLTRANFTAAAYRVIGPEPALAEVSE